MRRSVLLSVGVTMVLAATLLSCVTPVYIDTPQGFAHYSHASVPTSVSPEGVVVRARVVENEPPQSLAFWAEALQLQLTASGYFLVDQSDFASDAGPGVLFEWAAPVDGEDWIYLTAIAVSGDEIAVVESAGLFEHYQRYRTAIRESLQTLSVEAQ